MEIGYEEPEQLKSEQTVPKKKTINIHSCCTELQPCKSRIMIGYMTLRLVTVCDEFSMIFTLVVL
jgi:hypothetical protein